MKIQPNPKYGGLFIYSYFILLFIHVFIFIFSWRFRLPHKFFVYSKTRKFPYGWPPLKLRIYFFSILEAFSRIISFHANNVLWGNVYYTHVMYWKALKKKFLNLQMTLSSPLSLPFFLLYIYIYIKADSALSIFLLSIFFNIQITKFKIWRKKAMATLYPPPS